MCRGCVGPSVLLCSDSHGTECEPSETWHKWQGFQPSAELGRPFGHMALPSWGALLLPVEFGFGARMSFSAQCLRLLSLALIEEALGQMFRCCMCSLWDSIVTNLWPQKKNLNVWERMKDGCVCQTTLAIPCLNSDEHLREFVFISFTEWFQTEVIYCCSSIVQHFENRPIGVVKLQSPHSSSFSSCDVNPLEDFGCIRLSAYKKGKSLSQLAPNSSCLTPQQCHYCLITRCGFAEPFSYALRKSLPVRIALVSSPAPRLPAATSDHAWNINSCALL